MSADGPQILVIEDDASLRLTLAATFKAEGYRPIEAENAKEGLRWVAHYKPDLILLDLGLPDRDGMDVIRALRDGGNRMPIVVLTARDDEKAKVAALDLGADDYITKPFGVAELLARARSALRHGVQERGSAPIVRTGPLEIDLARRVVCKAGAEIRLTRKEFDLLAELALRLGEPVSHADLLNAVWGSHDADIRYLRVYIGQVREKIETKAQEPAFIVAEQGFGYRLVNRSAAPAKQAQTDPS